MINKIILSAIILSITVGSCFALYAAKEQAITSYMVGKAGSGYITDLTGKERAEVVKAIPYSQNIELGFIGCCVFITVFSFSIIGFIFRPRKPKDPQESATLTEC